MRRLSSWGSRARLWAMASVASAMASCSAVEWRRQSSMRVDPPCVSCSLLRSVQSDRLCCGLELCIGIASVSCDEPATSRFAGAAGRCLRRG